MAGDSDFGGGNGTAPSVSLVSLGCPKNLVDSERLVSALLTGGFTVITDPAAADAVIVNTCGFLEASRRESLETLRGLAGLKARGLRRVLVAGCMVPGHRDLLRAEVPEIDAFIEFADYGRLPEILAPLLPPRSGRPTFLGARRRVDAQLTPRHTAWLKISEGCNHPCTFCIIPSIRGPMRSLPIPDLVARARTLAGRGVVELNLIAQDLTLYGADLYGRVRLPDLLGELAAVPGLRWIRLLYAYPGEVSDALIDVVARGAPVLPYLDMPIQHSEDRILASMRRLSTRRTIEETIDRLRHRIPGIALRTTLIVGFPGETDADFERLLEFVRARSFTHLGAFIFSPEPGSPAASFADAVPRDVAEDRWARLMETQRGIVAARSEPQIGRDIPVLVDAAGPAPGGGIALGRTAADAPDIDGRVILHAGPGTGAAPAAGDIVTARVTAVDGWDLVARILA